MNAFKKQLSVKNQTLDASFTAPIQSSCAEHSLCSLSEGTELAGKARDPPKKEKIMEIPRLY